MKANELIEEINTNGYASENTCDTVKAGEAIALVGNTGKNTTGPHLHFELWNKGRALDPSKYIVF